MHPVIVSQVGTGSSGVVVLDYRLQNGIRVAVETTGTVTYTVEHEDDDPFNVPASSMVFFPAPSTSVVAATTNGEVTYQQTPAGIRVRNTAGTGTTKMIVIPQGRRG